MSRTRVTAVTFAAGALTVGLGASASATVGLVQAVPTHLPSGHAHGAPSQPLDRTTYNRRAIPADHMRAITLPAGYSLVDVVVSAGLGSTDTSGDSEPSLAVNGGNANLLDGYTFSSDWIDNGDAALWTTGDGGATWTKSYTVPPPTGRTAGSGCPCDTTLDYDRGGRLFGTFLNEVNASGDIYTGDTTNPTSAAAWAWFVTSGLAQKTDIFNAGAENADQPWLRVNRDPSNAARDDAYVTYFDLGANTIRVAVAPGSAPPNFTTDNSPGIAGCCVNPGARLASDHATGVTYAAWEYALGKNLDGSVQVEYAINRSTDAGATWNVDGFSSGIVVATANSNQPTPKFGTVNALLGGVDAASVDPQNGDVYYVYGTEDGATGDNRLAIRRLTTDGSGDLVIGAEHFVTGQVQAALPSVAVASNGTIGVLYDTYEGVVSGFPKFTTHLAQSTDHGVSFNDASLVSFLSPATDNGNSRQRVLGDYQQLRSAGSAFFGLFPGNGAAFGRSVSNIDPIFIKAPAATSADSTPPTITAAPKPSFATNATLGTTNVPTKISWAATDSSGVCSYELSESVNSGGFTPVTLPSSTARSVKRMLVPGSTYRYEVRATDCSTTSNTSAWTLGPSFTLQAIQDTSGSITYAGSWSDTALTGAYGGTVASSSTGGSTATFAFTGRAVGWVSTNGPDRGQAQVFVDGVLVQTIDLVAASQQIRKIVFGKSFSSSASHTIQVKVVGTTGRPRTDVDAFVVAR